MVTKGTKRAGKDYRYCAPCHADYMREWRKTHKLNAQQRKKDTARSYARVYLLRGKIKRRPCRRCGKRAEMHHPDYTKPTKVVWLCKRHHITTHLTK